MGLPTQDLKEPIYFYNYKRIHSVIYTFMMRIYNTLIAFKKVDALVT